ncbi:acyl-CoA N-acyltransferase [Collybia nuda]|uniref:Acyl-CoA N-acyltransferase n=1 Tax=Collybia nuda TaxID=64659 RepID=A0A9P5Y7L1_9AGAR|nr:acyl-CoA N-acyltransferase [Collybia nuda]
MPQHTTILHSPTGRIRLVYPSSEDDEATAAVREHPMSLQYLRFLPKKVTPEDTRNRREQRAEKPEIIDFNIHIVNPDGTTTFAGTTGIFNVDLEHESFEAGILVSPDLQRGGFATEALYTLLKYAFEEKNLHRGNFETSEDNLPMRSWLENVLGAKLEGKRREAWKESEGRYRDVTSYSILEQEWTSYAKARLEKSMFDRI